MKRISPYMFYVAFVAALGGLLFGFDTAVISGAEKDLQATFNLDDFWHGFTIATALMGTIVGAIFCSHPVEKLGRRNSLRIIALLYLISALGSGTATNWYLFMIFRFIGGLGVGASSVVGPMYIAEISPASWRGRFVAFFQFNIVFGMLLAYFTNYWISGLENTVLLDKWQWMLLSGSVPALLFTLLLFTIPESPRWLVKHGRTDEARQVFVKTGENDVEGAVAAIEESLAGENAASKAKEGLLSRAATGKLKFRVPILIAILTATLNQFCGVNAVLYYAPRILEQSGVFHEGAMLQSVLIGLTNMCFTMLGMFLIDRVGRKKLLGIGGAGMAFSLAMVARGFAVGISQGWYMLIFLVLFIAFFAISQGATVWVIMAEIFPTSVRSTGQAFGSTVHWMWAAIISWFFPMCLSLGSIFIFGFFSIMALGSLAFAIWLPDTKGKSLEQIQKELVKE